MTYDRSERIRRAAILVASLDEALAESLLGELPPLESAKVLAELDRMESIDPEEQEDVLAEFRRATERGGNDRDAVEFTYSQPTAAQVPQAAAAPPNAGGLDADVAAMAELLSHEHPQIIAAALTRLDGEQGAAVFAALPVALHAEVLDRVSRLTLVDEEAVQEVEMQLLQQVGERRARRERAAAGAERARRLLAKTPPQQQAVLLERLSGGRPTTAPAAPRASAVSVPPRSGWTWRGSKAPAVSPRDELRLAASADASGSGTMTGALAGVEAVLDDQSQALEALSDECLVAALRMVDDETGLRALASASERLVKRISRRLPRGQARSLRRLLRSFGPTRLADLRQAQHELLRIAHESLEANAA
jgi:flagellar motor switch protein FliG